ncbi:MAG: hypothetical protein ACREQB_12185 [Candidatus Binataceae bacterium]
MAATAGIGRPITDAKSCARLAALLFALVLAPASSGVAQAQRVVAIAPVPAGPYPFTQDKLDKAIDLARNAGVTGDQLFATWSALEPSPGVYNLTDLQNAVAVLGGSFGWKLEVTIAVLNTTVRETPADLSATAFDDGAMIQRMHALIDQIVPLFNSNVKYVAIGNEVDIYLANHPAEWSAYRTFYEDAAAYLRSLAPNVEVGVTTTFSLANGSEQANVAALNSTSDVVIFTYYPLGDATTIISPDAPLIDFPRMVQLGGGKPVVLQEVGLPSSPRNASSARKQARFVRSVFTAWQSVGALIPFLSYFCMHNFPPALCDELVGYYGVDDPTGRFRAFICTLGLRTATGKPKPGWNAFVTGAQLLNASQSIAAQP